MLENELSQKRKEMELALAAIASQKQNVVSVRLSECMILDYCLIITINISF